MRLTACLAVTLLCLSGCGPSGAGTTPEPPSPPAPPNAVATVRVALSEGVPVKLRQGFLHGLTTGQISELTQDRITALQPGAWRVSNLFGTFEIVVQQQVQARFGTRVAFNLQDQFSAQWGNPVVVGPDCVANTPSHCFADYGQLKTAWSIFADQFMQSVVTRAAPVDQYDIFSEPGSTFKGVTQAQLFELLKIAHDAIRRVKPDAVIVAPSIERFDAVGLRAMADFAAASGVRIDALSWHELEGTPADVAAHVTAARQLASQAYATSPVLAPTQIHINEYGAPQNHLIPGWTLGWLAAFEASGVDVATRACWQATAVWSDCANGLNGLLLEDNSTPQPLYHVHRFWAALPAGRLPATSDTAGVVAIAARDGAGVALLLGRYSCGSGGKWCLGAGLPVADQPLAPLDLRIELDGLGSATAARASIECATNLATPGALSVPVNRAPVSAAVSAGRVKLTISSVGDGDVCAVRVVLSG